MYHLHTELGERISLQTAAMLQIPIFVIMQNPVSVVASPIVPGNW